jgi:hypothetical protein
MVPPHSLLVPADESLGHSPTAIFASAQCNGDLTSISLAFHFHRHLCPDCQPNGQISCRPVHRDKEREADQN